MWLVKKKKYLIIIAVVISVFGAAITIAGGIESRYVPVINDRGIYIEASVGDAVTNWKAAYAGVGIPVISISNGNGAFAVGGTLGYQWSRYLAAEFGGYYNSITSVTVMLGANPLNVRFTNWFLYMAFKLMAPLPWINHLVVYVKSGLADRVINIVGGRTAQFLRPLGAVGLQYSIGRNWYVAGQWMHIAGASAVRLPRTDQLSIAIGCKLDV